MKPSSALLLQIAVVLVGLGVLTFLLWEPHLEGRNAHATVFAIYFKDPFLAYVYAGSIPFFVGLHRAFRALGVIRQTGASPPSTAEALQFIQRCALAVVGFAAGAGAIVIAFGDKEDRRRGFSCDSLWPAPRASSPSRRRWSHGNCRHLSLDLRAAATEPQVQQRPPRRPAHSIRF